VNGEVYLGFVQLVSVITTEKAVSTNISFHSTSLILVLHYWLGLRLNLSAFSTVIRLLIHHWFFFCCKMVMNRECCKIKVRKGNNWGNGKCIMYMIQYLQVSVAEWLAHLTAVWEDPGLNHATDSCVYRDSCCDIQPSTLRGTVKWLSAYGLSNNRHGGCGW